MCVRFLGGMAEVQNGARQSVVTVPQGRLGYLLSQVDSEGTQEDLVWLIVTQEARADLEVSASCCSAGI